MTKINGQQNKLHECNRVPKWPRLEIGFDVLEVMYIRTAYDLSASCKFLV